MNTVYSLSVKEINNKPTKICRKNDINMFMSRSNQIHVTKQIYLAHKNNHGILGYLYFKTIVPSRMYFWVSNKNLENNPDIDKFIDIVTFLNKLFIKDNSDLFEFKAPGEDIMAEQNVYKAEATFAYHLDNGSTYAISKKFQDLTAEDIRNIDVWAPQTTDISNINKRYRNEIPAWQKSMNVRNYSRENEGLRTTANRSSLNNILNGYGDDMKMLQNMKTQQLKKYKN